ncbi:DUF4252 domain-containing protein [Chitinophaga sp. sic0106]|uniref:DUF4252 domain-containing protein n=1 Tax=Chitinophaga sp. sic0106 TaxID=2854785 RepID=UPI001C489F9D|nr:DUF4252 domain-containing protein [Chitinophaga sp. sic0106]MBV7529967.1 DUF4252 domain-containing protein [Chitinophaga sp. sic0106]
MKRSLLLIITVLLSCQLFAQQGSSVIERFFQRYENDRSFTVITITPKMFSMFGKFDANDPDAKTFMRVVQKLKGLRILSKETTKDGQRLYREAAAYLGSDFEELMTIRDKESDLKFLVKENAKGNINELVMLVGGTSQFLAMSLVGDIDLNEISQIASNIDIQGMDNLKNVRKKK